MAGGRGGGFCIRSGGGWGFNWGGLGLGCSVGGVSVGVAALSWARWSLGSEVLSGSLLCGFVCFGSTDRGWGEV